MTKLNWCREYAPDALQLLNDEELMSAMEDEWNTFGKYMCEECECTDEDPPLNTD